MSPMFEKLKQRYEMGYILIDTLRGYVELNDRKPGKGITREEFKIITGEDYE